MELRAVDGLEEFCLLFFRLGLGFRIFGFRFELLELCLGCLQRLLLRLLGGLRFGDLGLQLGQLSSQLFQLCVSGGNGLGKLRRLGRDWLDRVAFGGGGRLSGFVGLKQLGCLAIEGDQFCFDAVELLLGLIGGRPRLLPTVWRQRATGSIDPSSPSHRQFAFPNSESRR